MNIPGQRRHSGGSALLRVVVALMVVVVLAWLGTHLLNAGGDPAATVPPPTDAQIKEGAYLAQMGDCVACHTAQGGKPFAGGRALASPIGTIYSTNITPDPKTGIGSYTYGQFERAVRRGVSAQSHTLYPAMPYFSYAKVTDQDIQSLYAYFMRGVAPIEQVNRVEEVPWPLSMRWPLAYWRHFLAPKVAAVRAQSGQDPSMTRGQYIVEGLGHCGACHTPRAITLQEDTLSVNGGPSYLAGGEADSWVAPSLRGETASGLGRMSEEDLVALLKNGRSDRTAMFGGMSEVVEHSTQYMTNEDLSAIAHFLKSLPPARQEATPPYDQATHAALSAGDVSAPGAQLYIDNCASCHRTDGHGYAQIFPRLAGNPVLNGERPGSVIRLVLQGGTMPTGRDAPSQFSMPAFRDRLSDQQVAELVTFVRISWGNRGSAVTPAQVQQYRGLSKDGRPLMTGYDPRATEEPPKP